MTGFGKKLGGRITSIKNYFFDIDGIPLQINIVTCTSRKDAENVYGTLASIHQSAVNCLLIENCVYEFIGRHTLYIKKAQSLLSDKKLITVWNVEFDLVPLKKSQDMEWNKLFNLLLEYKKNKNNTNIQNQILQLTPKFEFTNLLHFNNKIAGTRKPEYRIDALRLDSPDPDIVTFKINHPVYELDIPWMQQHQYQAYQTIISRFLSWIPGKFLLFIGDIRLLKKIQKIKIL
ncbi:hypothetical protein JW935_13600 [candidate division KSB1 bacterium]|nr:hypothetical protein [candidate division KSB1 bacterium]